MRWRVGKPWEKVEIIDEKTGWAITKNRNSFLLSALAQIYQLSIHTTHRHTHRHCRWMCKFQSNASRKEIKHETQSFAYTRWMDKSRRPKDYSKQATDPKNQKKRIQPRRRRRRRRTCKEKKTLVSFPSGNALSLSQCVPPPFYVYATSRE